LDSGGPACDKLEGGIPPLPLSGYGPVSRNGGVRVSSPEY